MSNKVTDLNSAVETTIREQSEKKRCIKRWRSLILGAWFRLSDCLFIRICNKRLKDRDFTIIANNCWGGVVYEYFGLRKNSPTVGTYFFSEDYIRFVSNLEYYLSQGLKMINSSESKYHEVLEIKKQTNVPIGKLNDIEVFFLHYKTPMEAQEKWNRRVKRINWDNIILKFSEMNLCRYEHLQLFDMLPYKKVLFVKKDYPELKNYIKLPFYSNCVSLLDDIPEYRLKMHKIKRVLGW